MKLVEKLLLAPCYLLLLLAWVYLAVLGLLLFPYYWYDRKSFRKGWEDYISARINSFNHFFEI